MAARQSTEIGLSALAGAFLLALVRTALPYFWDAVLAGTPAGAPSSVLHTLWIPLSGLLVEAAIAILGLVGFGLLYRGRWEFGAASALRSGLVLLAMLVAAVAFGAYFVTGIALGLLSGLAILVPWHSVLLFAGSVAVGLALYWSFAPIPVSPSRGAAAVALALGISGSTLLLLATAGLRRADTLRIQGAGLGLSVASLVLWLALCFWDARGLRLRRAPPAAAVAPHEG